MAKITIITASYNYENYIRETIESVINQTFQDWEMLIVDDGSKDNSVNIIQEYCQKDPRIKLYQHENGLNKGLAETIKLGLAKANSEWIAFLESDDIWETKHLEEKFAIINKNPSVNFIYCDVEMFGEQTEIEKYINCFYKKITKKLAKGSPLKDLSPYFVYRNWVYTFSVVMCKKALFNDCNFNSPIKAILDYFLWAQIAQKTEFYYLEKKLTKWRIHKKSYAHRCSEDYETGKIFATYIANFATKNFKARWHAALKKIKIFRQSAIRIRLKDNTICLFNKTYKLKNEANI